MAAFNFHQRRTRRWWYSGTALVAGALLAVFLVAGASANPLSGGSTFDTGNGSLYQATFNDWNPPNTPAAPGGTPSNNKGPLQAINCGTAIPGAPLNGNCALDWVNSSSDNAFGQGTSEDDTSVTVVDGSIPPQKDDLTRFYINQQTAQNQTNCDGKGGTTCHFLDLAWERTNLLGSAHMDFEFNQADPGITNSSTGSVTLNRTPGDILVDFDFGGSGVPVLNLHFWVGGSGKAASGQCESSNTLPCWGPGTALSTAVAQASVNSTTRYDFNPPNAPTTLSGSTSNNGTISSEFGEATINLEGAGVFDSNKCESLGFAWLKSRSSGQSFTSEMKDFISPLKTSVTNCGSLLIYKTDGTNALAGATFTATPGSTDTSGNTATSSTLTDEAPTYPGYYCIDNMKLGQSTVVHESQAPAGFNAAADQTITVTNGASCATRLAAATILADGTTFVDTPQVGAIKITKTGKDKNCTAAGAPDASCAGASSRYLAADFQLKQSGTTKYSGTTDSTTGVVCIDSIKPGSYTLHESSTPSGYQGAADQTVTVAANTSCNGTGTSAPLAVSVDNLPLTTITVSTTPAVTGATTSTVKCVNSSTTGGTDTGETSASATPHTTISLVPGTYTCTVVIDP